MVGFVYLGREFEKAFLFTKAVRLANFASRFACFISALNGTGMFRRCTRTGDQCSTLRIWDVFS